MIEFTSYEGAEKICISNSAVATVNNGIITGVKAGTATISASFTDSDGITSTASCTVYVTIDDGV